MVPGIKKASRSFRGKNQFLIPAKKLKLCITYLNLKAMKPSSDKQENSPKYYRTGEEFLEALNSAFAASGITVRAEMAQPEPTNNSGKDTYQIQFFPEKSKES